MEVARKEVFTPHETADHPFDVSLVVENGKEFKAHRKVLSEASPFFENMLNCNMRERNEGVVRFEMLTEYGLGDVLEFIYTGSVAILSEDHAKELILIGDYMFIHKLKLPAGKT